MSDYLRPARLSEGLALINENTRIVAGATDIIPARTSAQAWGQHNAETWLDITGLAELRGIDGPDLMAGSHWRIGALVTWTELIRAELPAAFAGLVAAAREVGGVQIQNRGTLAGNLCNASPAADGVPALLCLDASVELSCVNGKRCLPVAQFIQGNRQTALQANEMLTAITVPWPVSATPTGATAGTQNNSQGYFYKLGARRYLVISIVMLSALVSVDDDGKISAVRIAIGACSATAQRLTRLENDLLGCAVDSALPATVRPDHFSGLSPIDDVRADARYRQAAAMELVNRLLQDMQSRLAPGAGL